MRISDWSSDVCSSDLPSWRRPAPASERNRPMSVAGRIERLRLDTRRAIAKNMRVLQDQRRAAIRDGDVGEVARLQELIRALRRISRSEEHTSELQSIMRISYAVFCLQKKKTKSNTNK